MPEFQVDVQYDDQSVYEIGNCAFWAEHSPGHTPGTSSIFYRVAHRGKPVVCAIQGGMGFNGLRRAELAANGLPASLQQDYVDSLLRQADLHMDCYTPAHHPGYNILDAAARDDGSGDAFIDASVWPRLLRGARGVVSEAVCGGVEIALLEVGVKWWYDSKKGSSVLGGLSFCCCGDGI